jgi:drug/metabolite transporter (DMT)-like permease
MTSSWMLVAGALFALMGTFAKLLAPSFSAAELSLYRSVIGLIIIGAFVLLQRKSLRTPFWRGHFWRGFLGTISLIGYFYTMTKLPLATAIALNYTSPLFLTVLSTILLKEKFRLPLVGAILIGFVGVALLLRPTFEGPNAHAAFIGLGSGFFAACAYVNVKKLGDAGEPEWRVVFYFALAGTIGSALFQATTAPAFHPINASNTAYLGGLGLAATAAQLAMTRAYHSGKTLVVGTFAYSTVLFSAIFGIVFFDEILPAIAWVGMAVIVLGGILAKLATQKVAIPSGEAD